MVDSFQRETLKDGFLIIEEVKQFKFLPVKLQGQAIITHVGGNGRFKFLLDGGTYLSGFAESISSKEGQNTGFNKETDVYYDYSEVEFDRNIQQEWSNLYIYHQDKKSYWKAIEPKIAPSASSSERLMKMLDDPEFMSYDETIATKA